MSWTSFNMASSIVDKSLGSLAFAYDTGHARIMQCTPDCSAPTSTTLYLNDPATGMMEEAAIAGGTTSWTDYIAASGGIVAIRNSSGGTTSYMYVTGDHLGSVSLISDASGGLVAGGRQSYDPWGQRRNADGTPAANCAAITSATTRGYTGQEEMDSGCLVNLNGRIYYPVIGRMLSADPTIPDPLNTQSYNRYSYVNNNPLNATDPSGFAAPGCPTDAPCKPIDHGYGPLCFDCAGPGETSDASGNIVTLQQYEAENAGSFTFTVNGKSQTFPASQFMNGVEWAEGLDPNATFVRFEFPQYGFTLNNFAVSTGQGSSGSLGDEGGIETAVVNCGCVGEWTMSALGAAFTKLNGNGSGWLTYNPAEGDFTSGRWLAVGGNTLHVYVNNSNVLGLHGWRGTYSVYALDKYGNIIPNVCAPGNCATNIGALMTPMTNYTFSYQTNPSSPSGLYLWDVNLDEATDITADNQIDFQFGVSVADVPQKGH